MLFVDGDSESHCERGRLVVLGVVQELRLERTPYTNYLLKSPNMYHIREIVLSKGRKTELGRKVTHR